MREMQTKNIHAKTTRKIQHARVHNLQRTIYFFYETTREEKRMRKSPTRTKKWQVDEIRNDEKSTLISLSKKYNIGISQIWRIRHKLSWYPSRNTLSRGECQ